MLERRSFNFVERFGFHFLADFEIHVTPKKCKFVGLKSHHTYNKQLEQVSFLTLQVPDLEYTPHENTSNVRYVQNTTKLQVSRSGSLSLMDR